MGHDDCVDTVGNGIACEDENETIPASSDIGKRDLASDSLAEHFRPVGVLVWPCLVRPGCRLGCGERVEGIPLGVALASKTVEKLADSLVQQIAPGDARLGSGGIEFFSE